MKWTDRGLFLYFRFFNKVLQYSCYVIKFADESVRTMDIWFRKRPLYQLSHNYNPIPNDFALTSLTGSNHHG